MKKFMAVAVALIMALSMCSFSVMAEEISFDILSNGQIQDFVVTDLDFSGYSVTSSDTAIIAEDGTPYILAWSHATQGNASADAARTYLLFWLNGAIEGAKKYLDLFCKKSNTAKQYVQKWMPIVAASQSVKGNEHEREFLLSWVDVVDYE